jgi:hypothetical protein
MNDLQQYKTEIRALIQAAINAEVLQERLEIVKELECWSAVIVARTWRSWRSSFC